MPTAAASTETLLEVFTRYNQDLWPAHLVAYALGAALVTLLVLRPRATRAITSILAVLWIWLGVVFQGMYATDLDAVLGAAYAVLFVGQGVLFIIAGRRGQVTFEPDAPRVRWWGGWAALSYALLVYPVVGIALGHGWPESPLFGMAPCPTTIATFGILLLTSPPAPRHLLVVPLIWALLAPPAAVGRGVWEDLGLLVVGIAAAALLLRRRPPRRGVSRGESARMEAIVR
ncbi:MAG TPA: DUF6064 family protein [Nocardioides sp.]|uniref:DUF6064 family protein n=1 Tax=Nocardioides sp. TaxID=35761 RepID=UPI002E3022AE|nr:DUF6064 family protein [Nocardioides sp.]HEX5088638.1 DUF6064 family protein [Nocardioides sp.]